GSRPPGTTLLNRRWRPGWCHRKASPLCRRSLKGPASDWLAICLADPATWPRPREFEQASEGPGGATRQLSRHAARSVIARLPTSPEGSPGAMSSSSYARKEAGSDVIEYGLLAVVISALLIFIIADPLRITQ